LTTPPEFLGWVVLWISGEYDISDLSSRYNDLTARRAQRLRSVAGAVDPNVPDAKPTDIPDADGGSINPSSGMPTET